MVGMAKMLHITGQLRVFLLVSPDTLAAFSSCHARLLIRVGSYLLFQKKGRNVAREHVEEKATMYDWDNIHFCLLA